MLDNSSKSSCLSAIEARFEELGIVDASVIESTLREQFSSDIVESYNRIEIAPNDYEQIEMVSETLTDMSEFQIENWERMDLSEKI